MEHLEPGFRSLHEFLTAAREARGKGTSLALMAQGASPQAWYAASTAMMHRGLLTFGGNGGTDREEADRSASLTYLATGPAAGYASLVPLDHHPWGGYVIVGDETVLLALRSAQPDPVPGFAEATWEDVGRRAGSLAI